MKLCEGLKKSKGLPNTLLQCFNEVYKCTWCKREGCMHTEDDQCTGQQFTAKGCSKCGSKKKTLL